MRLSLPADGTAMYVGFASLGGPVFATPSGTLLTTLRFHALAPTSLSPITLLASAGSPAGTSVVFDSTVPNLSVTGTLTGAGVQIIPAPASCAALALPGAGGPSAEAKCPLSRTIAQHLQIYRIVDVGPLSALHARRHLVARLPPRPGIFAAVSDCSVTHNEH